MDITRILIPVPTQETKRLPGYLRAVTIPHKATVSSWFLLSHSRHMMIPNPQIQFIGHGIVSNNPELSRMYLWLFTR